MSISEEKLKKLTSCSSSSWAIWSDNFDDIKCIERTPENIYEHILKNKNKLRNNLVFLGLNQSGTNKPLSQLKHFQNFHCIGRGCNDKFLYRTIKNKKRLIGGFMTDIEPNIIETNSKKVNIKDSCFKEFINKLKILEAKEINIICFGNKTFNFMIKDNKSSELEHNIKYFTITNSRIKLNFFKVRHYSSYQKYKDELEIQLDYLNKTL